MRSRTVLIVVAVLALLALLAVAVLAAGRAGLFTGARPALGTTSDGPLTPCPTTPNCVSSQASATDTTHHIPPLAFRTDAARAWGALKETVGSAERAQIIEERSGYLRAEFTSRVLGFVDDVEFQLDAPAKRIHVRSASRLGRSDLGVNRARIESLRAQLAAAGV